MSTLKRQPQLSLQERDISVLRGLFECRIMTVRHMAAIYFEGREEYAKKRAQRYKAAGLISERRRLVNEPAILFLARKGLDVLRNHGALVGYPPFTMPSLEKRARVSDLTIQHELAVMDVKAAFHKAMQIQNGFSIAEFGTWPRLYQFEATATDGSEVIVRPDGFIRMHEEEADGVSEHTFFLEVDRSTETQDYLASRAAAYLNYYKSGEFAVRHGAPRSSFKEYPFRVLMVFKTAERRNNTAARLLQNIPPIRTHACLATIAEVMADPLSAIWICPVDYCADTTFARFDSDGKLIGRGYKLHTARTAFVEQRLKKRRLL